MSKISNRSLPILLIDYTKAFDSINHKYLIKALEKQRVPQEYIDTIEEMYSGINERIITEKITDTLKYEGELGRGTCFQRCFSDIYHA